MCEGARQHDLALHLDDAKLWNTSTTNDESITTLARPFNSMSMYFSKNLGAPIDSALTNPRSLVEKTHRLHKMLDDDMRQINVLATTTTYTLEHHLDQLAINHENARALATALTKLPNISIPEIETNIVMIDLPFDAEPLVRRATERDLRLSAFGPRRLRAITHLNVNASAVERTASILRELIDPEERARP